MTLAEAFTILDAVCAHHVGTLADHQQIQAALKELNDRLNGPETDERKPS